MIRALIGMASFIVLIIFSNIEDRESVVSTENIHKSVDIPDWSQDTTISYQKRNYLERVYASSSN
jgi:hypothetical protein